MMKKIIMAISILALTQSVLADGVPQDIDSLETDVTSLQSQDASFEARIAALESLVVELQAQINSNAGVTAANTVNISDNNGAIVASANKLQHVSVVDGELNGVAGPHFIIEGANVHVRSGAGSTGEGCNAFAALDCEYRTGRGNLIVGYNEPRPAGWDLAGACAIDPDTKDSDGVSICTRRDGAHHLVVGQGNNFSGHGGAVLGLFNEVKGSHATVTGGRENSAVRYASVSGGFQNIASRTYSSVSGGWGNRADGVVSSVTGGEGNIASGESSVVSGGIFGEAVGDRSAVSGGAGNKAIGGTSSVSGGSYNLAKGERSSVTGGAGRSADANDCHLGDNDADC